MMQNIAKHMKYLIPIQVVGVSLMLIAFGFWPQSLFNFKPHLNLLLLITGNIDC